MDDLCEVKVGSGKWQQARVTDLTAEGFRLSLTGNLQVGTNIKIRLPGLEILGAGVCWAKGYEVGCQFTHPLSLYVFEHMVRNRKAANYSA